MKALLRIPGINTNLADIEGRTALSLAAKAGQVEHVNSLLAVDGINPDVRDTTGPSPLPLVFSSDPFYGQRTGRRKEVLRRLLRVPAVDPNAEDVEGLTPLLRAFRFHNSREFVELLLARADLDVNRRVRNGLSPLALATKEAIRYNYN